MLPRVCVANVHTIGRDVSFLRVLTHSYFPHALRCVTNVHTIGRDVSFMFAVIAVAQAALALSLSPVYAGAFLLPTSYSLPLIRSHQSAWRLLTSYLLLPTSYALTTVFESTTLSGLPPTSYMYPLPS